LLFFVVFCLSLVLFFGFLVFGLGEYNGGRGQGEGAVHRADRCPNPWFIIDIKIYHLGNLDTAIRGIRRAGLPRTNHRRGKRGRRGRGRDEGANGHALETAGAGIVTRVATASTAILLLDLLGCRGLGLGPPVPRETRHRARLKHGSDLKTARSGIVTHNVAVGTRVLALDLDFSRCRADKRQKRARPLVVARGFAEGAVGHFESERVIETLEVLKPLKLCI
jgi:hypothetical protein